jgi:regulatory protein
MNPISYEQALHRLAAYCSRGERCMDDVRRKMDAWEMPREQQDKVIQSLQKEKFLDEARYCRAFVNDKSKFSRWGIYKIKYALKKKRLPDVLINEALQEIDPESNREQLHLLLEQKRKSVKGKNEFEIRQKLFRFAASRGFSQEEIEKALHLDFE